MSLSPLAPDPGRWANSSYRSRSSYVRARLRLSSEKPEDDFPTVITRAVHRQMAHVRRFPLYPRWGAYWYFVRRNTIQNRTVENLYARELDRQMKPEQAA